MKYRIQTYSYIFSTLLTVLVFFVFFMIVSHYPLYTNSLLVKENKYNTVLVKLERAEPVRERAIVTQPIQEQIKEDIQTQPVVAQIEFEKEMITQKEGEKINLEDDLQTQSTITQPELVKSILAQQDAEQVNPKNNLQNQSILQQELKSSVQTIIPYGTTNNIASLPNKDSTHIEDKNQKSTAISIKTLLNNRIKKQLTYPVAAVRRRLEGRVQVTLTVSIKGKVEEPVIAVSSGTSLLDSAALKLVKELDSLTPEECMEYKSELPYTLTLTVNYSLLKND